MIDRNIWMLAGTAATLGLVHTVIGPDHYLPFIVIGRARNWTLRKTLFVSFLAGLGHILSSVILGFLGIALGIALSKIKGLESARGAGELADDDVIAIAEVRHQLVLFRRRGVHPLIDKIGRADDQEKDDQSLGHEWLLSSHCKPGPGREQ